MYPREALPWDGVRERLGRPAGRHTSLRHLPLLDEIRLCKALPACGLRRGGGFISFISWDNPLPRAAPGHAGRRRAGRRPRESGYPHESSGAVWRKRLPNLRESVGNPCPAANRAEWKAPWGEGWPGGLTIHFAHHNVD